MLRAMSLPFLSLRHDNDTIFVIVYPFIAFQTKRLAYGHKRWSITVMFLIRRSSIKEKTSKAT